MAGKILCVIPNNVQIEVSAIPFVNHILWGLDHEVGVHYVREKDLGEAYNRSEYSLVIASGETAQRVPHDKKVVSPMNTAPGDFVLGILEEVLRLLGKENPQREAHRILIKFLLERYKEWGKRFYLVTLEDDTP